TGLVRVRSPLLAASRLMSFPPGTSMFQFPAFASYPYGVRIRYSSGTWHLMTGTAVGRSAVGNRKKRLPIACCPLPSTLARTRHQIPCALSGFPHSEIVGSKGIRTSPTLIAAYHVLHRLCMPRHPPVALKTLDHSHCQYPSGR